MLEMPKYTGREPFGEQETEHQPRREQANMYEKNEQTYMKPTFRRRVDGKKDFQ